MIGRCCVAAAAAVVAVRDARMDTDREGICCMGGIERIMCKDEGKCCQKLLGWDDS